MRTGKFCYHCGGELFCHDGSTECSSCGAVYSNLLVSETEFTKDGCKVLEIGLCADITIRTPVEVIGDEIRESVPSVVTSTLTPAEAVA
jgi:hypothetical protein